MPRSIWNGVISFGMVSIPVKLFAATEDKDIAFNQLHSKCNSRLKRPRWCPACEKEVEADEVLRGYEYSKGQYVILTDDDFEKLPLPSKHTIEVSSFVKAEQIDPVYYDASYYLEPDEAGVKPFALFMKALQEKAMTAVAKIAIRKKEQLCALRPLDGVLVLETLFHADEVKVPKERELPDVKISDQELQMASSLVDLLAGSFEPEKFKDQYREALREVIEAKLQGEEFVEAPAGEVIKITDLMEALRKSVEVAKGRKSDEKEGAAKKKAAG